MNSRTLSSVVEEQLCKLCLNDFPCGHGSWRRCVERTYDEESWGYMQHNGGEGAHFQEPEALIELLNSPRSPWKHEVSWSPQASTLRELSVLAPERLQGNFVFSHFEILRMVDKGVSLIDKGLLKFSNLKELVLSANRISEIPAHHFPGSLRVLELHANQISNLKDLNHRQLPHLQHLGLGSNRLGSTEDIKYLTGVFWPKLVSLDLSWCGFEGQRDLVEALATLPCLRTLVLEGNPTALVPSYPGFIIDRLPGLFHLDASRITADDRHSFRGLAKTELIVDKAAATLSVNRIRGVPDPLLGVDENATEFPVVNYSYFVTYEFLSQLPTDKTDMNNVTRHSTPKLPWAECMDLGYTRVHSTSDLGSLKSFLLRGLWLSVEEEKVISWPAPTGELPVAKPVTEKKGGKEAARPPSNTKVQPSKDKKKNKKESMIDLVQETPIRKTLGSFHVPLQNLVSGGKKVDILCNLGVLLTEHSTKAVPSREKDPSKKNKDDKKKDDKKAKSGDSAKGQKNLPPAKGKGKGGRKDSEVDVSVDNTSPGQLEPLTVEFSVQLEKWRSISEARCFSSLQ
ncbi:leucine-rich repeat-containing protein 43-like [Aplochiton taeniatus]